MTERIYKYKLDFYYKSLIIYFVTLIVYIIIKGNFTHSTYELVIKDPIIYIILIFILFFLILLVSNAVRAREIIFKDEKIIFKNRFGQREVAYNEILNLKFSREKERSREERSSIRIVKLKLKNRKRLLRIRLNDFQNELELVNEFKIISRRMSNKS
ncbi:MAG TPA: hypothetical protein PKD83_11330 [Ignavibacteria bacterium]|nr:hypothetical protein [Ignavibacteria bacterium]